MKKLVKKIDNKKATIYAACICACQCGCVGGPPLYTTEYRGQYDATFVYLGR